MISDGRCVSPKPSAMLRMMYIGLKIAPGIEDVEEG
jgi:hypothetical protein